MEASQTNRNINQYLKGQIIYEERTKANEIGLLIKGQVGVESVGVRDDLYSGSFLGVQDIYAENHLCTYRATEDTIICMYDANDVNHLFENILANADYCGLIIASLSQQLGSLNTNFESLYNGAVNAYNSILEYGRVFEKQAYSIKLQKDTISRVTAVQPPEKPSLDERLEYYVEMNTFSLESIRGFFSQGNYIVRYHTGVMSELYSNFVSINQNLVNYLCYMLDVLAGNSSDSIFFKYADLALLAQQRGKSSQAIVKVLGQIVNSIEQYIEIIETTSTKKVSIDCGRLMEVYNQVITGSAEEINYDFSKEELSDQDVLDETRGSLNIILNYAELDFEIASEFNKCVNQFAKLGDRMSIDDDIRTLRRHLSEIFYQVYEKVFLKAYSDNNIPLVIQLFLNYGLVDETLVTKKQLVELYHVSRIKEGGKFKVYTMFEWLTLIYEGKKQPSKNEYDLDYSEWLRAELIAKRITQKEYNEKTEDLMLKLQFEIRNFFKYVTRIANGKITTYVPILHQDLLIGNINHMHMSAHKIESTLQRIIDIDFSIFYRETAYVNRAKNIEKEYVMKEVLPDFVLAPTVGANGVMWQTISGRQKNTAGRFVLPIFLETNIYETMLKICARYRWEMCRTVQGATWNNIKYKSLTSEYLDYIQFFRKNHDLSEERKEKLRTQIQKCSNRTADVFALDYEAWIKGESQGAVRLNKVARKILAMYCPFERSLRIRVSAQPLLLEPIQAYELERQKKVKEINNHFKLLQNNQTEITPELLQHLEFYQNS